jgi:ADP-ribose pyrophosphatase YjhB (NUDIX family)
MHDDLIDAGSRWIPQAEYDVILSRVPILCVDLLVTPPPKAEGVGLIRRLTPDGEGWCLIGGAVLRNEPIADAVRRHLAATLGAAVSIEAGSMRLAALVQYFTETGHEFRDPRKHAVSLTFTGSLQGVPRPRGEALQFRWFEDRELPHLNFGFGQGRVVERILDGSGVRLLLGPWV